MAVAQPTCCLGHACDLCPTCLSGICCATGRTAGPSDLHVAICRETENPDQPGLRQLVQLDLTISIQSDPAGTPALAEPEETVALFINSTEEEPRVELPCPRRHH